MIQEDAFARFRRLHGVPESEPLTTWDQLQAQMRRDANDRIVCERCGGKVTWGWVYQYGKIVLATCGKRQCAPKPQPPWIQGVRFI
jgi:hypothetical protein